MVYILCYLFIFFQDVNFALLWFIMLVLEFLIVVLETSLNFVWNKSNENTNLMQHCAGFISAGSLYMFRVQAPIIRSI